MNPFNDFFLQYPILQQIIFIILLVGVLFILLKKGGFMNPNVIVLLIGVILIYLYSQDSISSLLFTISLLIIAIVLYMLFMGGNENEID